jgi:hypothetical protein
MKRRVTLVITGTINVEEPGSKRIFRVTATSRSGREFIGAAVQVKPLTTLQGLLRGAAYIDTKGGGDFYTWELEVDARSGRRIGVAAGTLIKLVDKKDRFLRRHAGNDDGAPAVVTGHLHEGRREHLDVPQDPPILEVLAIRRPRRDKEGVELG